MPEADRQLFGIVFDELLRRAPLDQARLRETTVAIRVRSVGRLPVTVTNRDLMTSDGPAIGALKKRVGPPLPQQAKEAKVAAHHPTAPVASPEGQRASQ